jgi:hypothetical protein
MMLQRLAGTQGTLDKDGNGRLEFAELNAALGPLLTLFGGGR